MPPVAEYLEFVSRALIGAAWGRTGAGPTSEAPDPGDVPEDDHAQEEPWVARMFPDPEHWSALWGLLRAHPMTPGPGGPDPRVLVLVEVLRAERLGLGPAGGALRSVGGAPSAAWHGLLGAIQAEPGFEGAVFEQLLWRVANNSRGRALAGSAGARVRYPWLRAAVERCSQLRLAAAPDSDSALGFQFVATDDTEEDIPVLGGGHVRFALRHVRLHGHIRSLDCKATTDAPVQIRVSYVLNGRREEHAKVVSTTATWEWEIPPGAARVRVQARAALEDI